jgi:hypothetical protein
MSLIPCPECEEKISDKALACPKCGCPIAEIPTGGPPTVQEIERCGKAFKAQYTKAVIVILIGIALCVIAIAFGVETERTGLLMLAIFVGLPLIAIGGIWHFITRLRAWWYHG